MTETAPQLPGLAIISKVGEGGMATVWKARNLQSGSLVAVKVLNQELTTSGEDISQFIREERTMEEIRHRGIVRSYGVFSSGRTWYYLMEFVDGYNFGQLLARKLHLPETDCLLICESVADALDHAWNEHGIVHRDIKPENIMINADGTVKVTDLGICHTFARSAVGNAIPEHILGTPAYISPEQIYGDTEPDCRADIYSLAASLYHLATGRMLFPGLDSDAMLRAHCDPNAAAKNPRTYRPELSIGFCRMLEAMLVKDRDERISSWGEVIEMCLEIERGEPIPARTTSGASSVRLD